MNKVSKDELHLLYVVQKKTMHKISKELGVSIGAVHKYLHKYGLPVRDWKSTFSMSGTKLSEEHCKRISEVHTGKKLSDVTKIKISQKHTGMYKVVTEFGGHKKTRSDGYIAVYIPTHPHASRCGYVMEHILVMERDLGRLLDIGEVVHHKNGQRADNEIDNLQLMTASKHMSMHSKERWDLKRRRAI